MPSQKGYSNDFSSDFIENGDRECLFGKPILAIRACPTFTLSLVALGGNKTLAYSDGLCQKNVVWFDRDCLCQVDS